MDEQKQISIPRERPLEKSRSKSVRFFSNPLVGFLGTISSIICLIALAYTYIVGKEKKEFTYACNPVKTQILKGGHESLLEVNWNKQKVNSDVVATQIALWNRGVKTIEKTDILEDITLYTEPTVQILDAQVRKASREVVKLSIDKVHMSEGYVTISWDILEQNDGGVIQLIFTGDEDTKTLIKGTIKEQKTIRQIEPLGKVRSPSEQVRKQVGEEKRGGILLLLLGIAMFPLAFSMRRTMAKFKRTDKEFEEFVKREGKEYEEYLIKKGDGDLLKEKPLFGRSIDALMYHVHIIFFIGAPAIIIFAILRLLHLRSVGPPFGF